MQCFYQDANSDPPVDITLSGSTIKPNFTQVHGWTGNIDVKHKEVSEEYALNDSMIRRWRREHASKIDQVSQAKALHP